MSRIFTSGLKESMEGFIAEKHALGFPYVDGERITANFDRFCATHYPGCRIITKEMGLQWATLHEGEGQKNVSTRIGVVRELPQMSQMDMNRFSSLIPEVHHEI